MRKGRKTRKMFLKVQNELKVMQTNLSIQSDKNMLAHHDRSSRQRCSINNCVLENFAKLTGKQSVFFYKVFFFKENYWRRCFPVIFTKFFVSLCYEPTKPVQLAYDAFLSGAAAVLQHIIPETKGQSWVAPIEL